MQQLLENMKPGEIGSGLSARAWSRCRVDDEGFVDRCGKQMGKGHYTFTLKRWRVGSWRFIEKHFLPGSLYALMYFG